MPTPPLARTRERLERVAGAATNPLDLFGELADALGRTMSLDGWCGHTLDPATSLPTGGDSRQGYPAELVPRLLEIEYRVGDVNPFHQLLQQPSPVGVLHDATSGRPETSPRYREVMQPSGFEHELRVVLRHQGRPWGALVLLRAGDAPAFGAIDRRLMASISSPVAAALRRVLLQGYVATGGSPRHAGLVLLDAGLRPTTLSPEAICWVRRLGGDADHLPLAMVALASLAAERDGEAVRSRARGSDGQWLTMTAWSLPGSGTAVTLESAAPHDLTALALEAYALSAREREVLELVLLGHSTARIGQQLFLSPYTVQDHLKAIFDKTGVRSRRELAADLFFRHYLPRIERGAALDADGWFDSRDERPATRRAGDPRRTSAGR